MPNGWCIHISLTTNRLFLQVFICRTPCVSSNIRNLRELGFNGVRINAVKQTKCFSMAPICRILRDFVQNIFILPEMLATLKSQKMPNCQHLKLSNNRNYTEKTWRTPTKSCKCLLWPALQCKTLKDLFSYCPCAPINCVFRAFFSFSPTSSQKIHQVNLATLSQKTQNPQNSRTFWSSPSTELS